MTDVEPAADWYVDPFGRYEVRYWDGSSWTEHVSRGGEQRTDAPIYDQPSATPKPSWRGDGTVLGEALIVVSQRAEVVGANTEYAVYEIGGRQIGAVRQLGTRVTSKVPAALGPIERFMTRRYVIIDMVGTVLLRATRPGGLGRARLAVRSPTGVEIGRVLRESNGEVMASFVASGERVGNVVLADASHGVLSVRDAAGAEVARIIGGAGAGGDTFASIDRQLLEFHQSLEDPLRSLALVSALLTDPVLPRRSENENGAAGP